MIQPGDVCVLQEPMGPITEEVLGKTFRKWEPIWDVEAGDFVLACFPSYKASKGQRWMCYIGDIEGESEFMEIYEWKLESEGPL